MSLKCLAKAFHQPGSQVVKGCGGDKCQRQHATVITTIPRGHALKHNLCFCDSLRVRPCLCALCACMPIFELTIYACARVLGARVNYLPYGHFGPTAARYGLFGSYPLLSWQQKGGGLQGSECKESSRSLPAVRLPGRTRTGNVRGFKGTS